MLPNIPKNQIFRLSKEFTFEAAHKLLLVPSGHQCGRLHGHSYRVKVYCSGPINPKTQWVVDYGEISKAVKPVIDGLDHQFLNDLFDFETTAENLSWWLCCTLSTRLPNLSGVEVFETSKTSVFCPWTHQ